MFKNRILASLLLALSPLAGCGTTKDLGAANAAVARFHEQLDNADFSAIYTEADQRFRDSSPQPEFLTFMNAVHTKLGNVTDATRQGFFVNFTTSGERVRLTYATKFAAGDAQEEFVWVKNGTDFALLGYHINSMALITK